MPCLHLSSTMPGDLAAWARAIAETDRLTAHTRAWYITARAYNNIAISLPLRAWTVVGWVVGLPTAFLHLPPRRTVWPQTRTHGQWGCGLYLPATLSIARSTQTWHASHQDLSDTRPSRLCMYAMVPATPGALSRYQRTAPRAQHATRLMRDRAWFTTVAAISTFSNYGALQSGRTLLLLVVIQHIGRYRSPVALNRCSSGCGRCLRGGVVQATLTAAAV